VRSKKIIFNSGEDTFSILKKINQKLSIIKQIYFSKDVNFLFKTKKLSKNKQDVYFYIAVKTRMSEKIYAQRK
jgi:hypothetical protein